MAGNATPVVITTTATTQAAPSITSMLDVFDKDRDCPHFLFALFLQLKKFAPTFDDMYTLLDTIGNTGSVGHRKAISGLMVREIKLATLIGLKEPSGTDPTKGVPGFLNTYFPNMNANARKQYFSTHYPGNFDNFFDPLKILLDSSSDSKIDDVIRIRIYANPANNTSFIKIVIEESQSGQGKVIKQEKDVYHITVVKDVDPKNRIDVSTTGRYIPSIVFIHTPPIKETIHLTKEDPLDIKKNIQYDFKYDTLEPVTRQAEDLVINRTFPPTLTPLGMLLGLSIPRGTLARSQAQTTGPRTFGRPQSLLNSSRATTSATMTSTTAGLVQNTSTGQGTVQNLGAGQGQNGGRRRTYRKKQKKRRTRRLRHF